MYFFIRTDNPRPTFHLDMTADGRMAYVLCMSQPDDIPYIDGANLVRL